ncbi:MAG: DEAD/DEAH box helicase family protein [Sulfuricaulis sp.]|uniref:DEAD/DEAH box helicase family protein n=1 Tax=Sulfuricaulis sp. TaxID=2003553 RepID=UPI0025D3B337|nr:DEAD/DEAH box helicase family protein [Sulfuricaulis sp.]MCR4346282.1 DEAD/DEAH box helicase family protein [Sulfuricaulis sp.]
MPASDYVKLEQRLVLADWACHQLGYESNKAMLQNLREVEEGFDGKGNSYLVQAIAARGSKCKVAREDLDRYDANIRAHLNYFNKHRKERLTLRYFQLLSLIIAEFFLDRRFNHEAALRKELNQFVSQRNSKRGLGDFQDPEFAKADLNKLAFLMATGSGKTILMHFHYRQFLHYNPKPLDNILLVTPDEGLSQQHLENMEDAGIPCARFSLEDSGFEAVKKNTMRVIEITKLVEEKKGSGVSVPVEAFEGNNLIFVDEGHKGASSEAGKWIGNRDKLAENGFTFEYSATFVQAMTAARDDEMTKEYGKAILVDYGYKYFYGDGFGKDFELLNLTHETNEEQTRMLLLANLLAFHEQKRAFHSKSEAMARYHLADPLWIFVGSTVNKSKDNKQAKESDVLTIVKFLDSFLRNKRGWVQKDIKRILNGESGIEADGGHDVFAPRFKRLKAWSKDADAIHRDLLKRVFHATGNGRLHVGDIKGKAGELGLKVSGAENYFGLVYIGDTAAFKTLTEEQCPDVEVEDDEIAEGLFENIKKPDSRINILIGAKKFMQGWDSWRVSNMGLLNIGRSEGSEIIQLFGRGVRLQGLNRSLKRSSALSGIEHPAGIDLLERLNIFAIRANYMTQFRDYLEREGVEPFGEVELHLPIKRNDDFLKKGLIAPRLPKESRFATSERIVLEPDSAARVTLDMSVRVESIGSADGEFQTSAFVGGTERWLKPEQFRWLDWELLYLAMLEFKEERGFHNLLILPEHPRQILQANDPKLYGLICDEQLLNPTRVEQAVQLQAAVSSVLNKYVESFYRKRQQRWDSSKMIYGPLKKDDANFQNYVVKVPRSDKDLLHTIHEAIEEWKKYKKCLSSELPNIHFDRHLYQPLLVAKGNKARSVPPPLNDGECKFVEDLKLFCKSEPALLKGKELFLLRNLSRGKGIGFFADSGFYPDFILWITEGDKQRLVFIEPHGMLNEDHPDNNSKIDLHKKLQTQIADARKKSKNKHLLLDAFIISRTPFDDLRKKHGAAWDRDKYAEAHVLFGDEPNNGHIEAIVSGSAKNMI